MRTYSDEEIKSMSIQLRGIDPSEIIRWVLTDSKRPVVTTNFRPYEAAILHAVVSERPGTPVVWCDTGYNTPQTYRHADEIIAKLNLTIDLYIPEHTAAYRDAINGGIPDVDSPKHTEFTRQVKLEPFNRAMAEQQPDIWFTNLRKGQTGFRTVLIF